MIKTEWVKLGVVAGVFAVGAGCAATRQVVPRPDPLDIGESTVHIELKRPSIVGYVAVPPFSGQFPVRVMA